MHSHYHQPTDTNFNINGDFSGDAIVGVDATKSDFELSHQDHRVYVRVPFAAMEMLVARKYRQDIISRAEEADDQDILRSEIVLQKSPTYEFVEWLLGYTDDPERRRSLSLSEIANMARIAKDAVDGA